MSINGAQGRFRLSGDLVNVETLDGDTYVTLRQVRRGKVSKRSSASFVLKVSSESVEADARSIEPRTRVMAHGYVERSGDRDSIIVVDRLRETPRRQEFVNHVEFTGELVQRSANGVLSQGWTLTRERCQLVTIKQGAKCFTVKVPQGLSRALMGVRRPREVVSVVGHMWPFRRGGRTVIEITAVSVQAASPASRRP